MGNSDAAVRLAADDWAARNTGQEPPTAEEVARLAYQLYETRGRQDGYDLDDWLLAEQELTRHHWLVDAE